MARLRKALFIGSACIVLVAGLWALHVELTFERNVRRGIPADFRLHNAHRPSNWRV